MDTHSLSNHKLMGMKLHELACVQIDFIRRYSALDEEITGRIDKNFHGALNAESVDEARGYVINLAHATDELRGKLADTPLLTDSEARKEYSDELGRLEAAETGIRIFERELRGLRNSYAA